MTNDFTLEEISTEGINSINSNFSTLKDVLQTKAELNGNSTQKFNVADAVELTEAINKHQLDNTVATINANIATKADKAYVDANLELKANKIDVNASLATKADKTYVDTNLALKANSADVNAALATKADLNGSSAQIFNVADAVTSTDAVSKGQLDNALALIDIDITKLEDEVKNISSSLNFSMNSGNIDVSGNADILYAPGIGTGERTWVQPVLSGTNGTIGTGLFALYSATEEGVYPLWQMMDGNSNTNGSFQASQGNTTSSMIIWSSVPIKISSLQLTFALSDYVTGFTLQSSVDGNNWINIGTYSGLSYSQTNTCTVASANTSFNNYYRICGNSSVYRYAIANLIINATYQSSVSTATSCLFKIGNSYPSLKVTYADKSQETLTSLASITGFSTNGNYTILKEKGSNPVAVLTSGILDGTAISSGDYAGYPASNAFDGNLTSFWGSSQNTTAVNGCSNIGKNFGSVKSINRIEFYQDIAGTIQHVTSVKIQYSSDGLTWNDAQTFTVGHGYNLLILTTAISAQYVRVLANSNTAGITNWIVNEILFYGNSVTQAKIFPVSPVDGDYHCLTATGLHTYKRVSGAWVETQYVPMGTVTVIDGIITATSTNPYNQNGYDVNIYTLPEKKYDYANPISKSTGVLYTAETNGLLYITGFSCYGETAFVIDGATYDIISYSSQGELVSGFAPITKGQTYEYLGGLVFKFVPQVKV